jgi:hypothetical protein
VLIPIAAVRDADGQLRVRSGQRRTIAAREAGLATVPVYVRTAAAGDERAEVAERVSEQIVENDQRRSLTDAQRHAASSRCSTRDYPSAGLPRFTGLTPRRPLAATPCLSHRCRRSLADCWQAWCSSAVVELAAA